MTTATAVSVWEALADPTRREIVRRLAAGSATAGEVADGFDISRPGVSRHLRVLREAGVVNATAQGTRQVYSLAPGALDDVRSWCDEVTSFWTNRLDALGTEIARGARRRKENPS